MREDTSLSGQVGGDEVMTSAVRSVRNISLIARNLSVVLARQPRHRSGVAART